MKKMSPGMVGALKKRAGKKKKGLALPIKSAMKPIIKHGAGVAGSGNVNAKKSGMALPIKKASKPLVPWGAQSAR